MARLKLFLLGHPVSQSRSPVMQNAALAHLGIDAFYDTLDVLPEGLDATLARLDADPSVLGCNVTVPHKVAVRRWLSAHGRTLRRRAEIAHAVNTLFRGPDGLLHGDSTDFDGAMDAILREGFGGDVRAIHHDLPKRDVAILGSGGSALSLATNFVHPWSALPDHADSVLPASITIFARDLAKAQTVADALAGSTVPVQVLPLSAFPAWNGGRRSLVIQTTTVGMETGDSAECSPVPMDALEQGQIAFDLVYKPHETLFLRDARAQGAGIVHGIGMLVGQGARSLERWSSSLDVPCETRTVAEVMANALGFPQQSL